MIGLNLQNGGGRFDELLLLEQGRRTGIAGHADILKQHAAEQEVHVVGERVGLRQAGRLGDGREAVLEVNRRAVNRLAAQGLAVEADMREFVLRELGS